METIKAFLDRWDILGFIIAGLIGAVIMLLIDGFKSLFSMKRKKYCISKTLISSTVYQHTDSGGLKITVSYKGQEVEGPLTILNIRLRNDGEEDIMYSQRIGRLCIMLVDLKEMDVSVNSDIDGVNPCVKIADDGKYDIKWDLLKSGECFYIKIIAKGEINDMASVKFDVRADGIDQIRTPEYRVSEAMIPIWTALALLGIPSILFLPSEAMLLDVLPIKWLYIGSLIFMALIAWIGALKRRIKWMKEQ